MGFCMGGALALIGAQHSEHIVAAAPFYGIPGPDLFQPENLKTPVQGHFGATDGHTGFSDPESARALEAKLKAAGSEVEIFIYEGQGHAFLNETPWPYKTWEEREAAMNKGIKPHNAEVAALAWGRVQAFFAKHLI